MSADQGTQRAIVAEFQKSRGKRLTLFSVTVIEDQGQYLSRSIYDVDYSRRSNCYLFHQSGGGGGSRPVPVSGIYFASPAARVEEGPSTLLPRALRRINKTRRLRALPRMLRGDGDLLDWLFDNAINDSSVYCSKCRDHMHGDDLCDHVWWCDRTEWWSTPSEPCGCGSYEQCSESASVEK